MQLQNLLLVTVFLWLSNNTDVDGFKPASNSQKYFQPKGDFEDQYLVITALELGGAFISATWTAPPLPKGKDVVVNYGVIMSINMICMILFLQVNLFV